MIKLSRPWSILEIVLFRFTCLYFFLYTFPLGIGVLPIAFDWQFINSIWTPLIEWTGKYVLKLDYEITVLPNGSGDTTWSYVQVLVFAVLAVVGTLIWSVVDRKRSGYPKLFFWLTVLIRYYLAITLIGYGFFKIIKTQFPFPMISQLLQPYGDSSPMRLLWTFMGYSPAYNFFTGFCEALGGFLLFFRSTRMLGALITVAVMSNIVMLNFTFDVPVKLFSSHLLLMSLFLLIPDAKRLVDFFVFNKPVSSEPITSVFVDRRWKIGHMIIKGLVISWVMLYTSQQAWSGYNKWGNGMAKNPFYGVYDVKSHIIGQDTIAREVGSTQRWNKFLVDHSNWGTIEYMDEAKINKRVSTDTVNHTIMLLRQDSTAEYTFHYKRNGNTLVLKGELYGDSIYLEMEKKEFLLQSRGFHWINEYPFNR